ncbi:MAG: TetR/AcrR family transcriptional regulator [Anaerolineae bacterium]|nr:TetR/AcrR family transcriptional regulator [Anaerolineae bacterium]
MKPDEKPLDRRQRRTRKLLRDALLQLIVEKGFDTLSVQDITDRADVSRATFYLHFRDKEDLLFNSMRELYDDLVDKVGLFSDPHEVVAQIMDGNHDACLQASDFEHVAEYANFYRVLLSEKGVASFTVQVRRYLAQIFREQIVEPALAAGNGPRLPPDLIAHALAGAHIGVISWWLESGAEFTPEQMARMTYSLSAFGMWWSLGIETQIPDAIPGTQAIGAS